MLKIAGAVLVIFSCSALGYSKSIHMTRRLQQLREIEKMVFLILGEITYRREALPEALGTVAYRLPEPLAGFLKEVSEAAGQYQGACFQEIFREKAKTYLSGTALCPKDLEEFLQLGAYLGYLDITMQKNTITLYLEQLKREMENLQREMPAKQKLYRSMEHWEEFSGNYASLKIMQGRDAMEVSLLFKIGAVGILVSVLCQILKHSQREELAFLTSLTGLCWCCSGCCPIFMTFFAP